MNGRSENSSFEPSLPSLVLVASIFLAPVVAAAPPPPAPTVEVADVIHGVTVPDPYRWLEEVDAPHVELWADAWDASAQQVLAGLDDRPALLARIRELARDHATVPERQGAFFVWAETTDGHTVHLAQRGPDGVPEIILDEDTVQRAPGATVTHVRLAPNGRNVAYIVATPGEPTMLRHRLADSDVDFWDRVATPADGGGPVWTADGCGLFVVRPDGTVVYRRPGSPAADDFVVYGSTRPDARVSIERSADGRLLVITDVTGNGAEVYVIDLGTAASPDLLAEPIALTDERKGAHAFVGSAGRTVYLLTNIFAARNRVVRLELDDPAAWFTVVHERIDPLERAVLVGDRIVLQYRHQVRHALEFVDRDGRNVRPINLDGAGTVTGLGPSMQTDRVVFGFETMTEPRAVFEHDLSFRRTEVLRDNALVLESDRYVTESISVPAPGGARIPTFIAYEAGLDLDGTQPLLLYVDGAAGSVVRPRFDPAWFTWIERGGIVAVTNVRGGNAFGPAWEDAARGADRDVAVDDLIAVARDLIDAGFTGSPHLVVHGTGIGGLLAGAAAAREPDLFGALVIESALLDLVRFSGWPGGSGWIDELGDPRSPEAFAALHRLSPLHAITEPACRPATLVTADYDDPRISPVHALKYAARRAAHQACPDKPVLLRLYADHGALAAAADRLAFAGAYTRPVPDPAEEQGDGTVEPD